LPRQRFTRQEAERFQASGLFDGQRCELIDGDLVDKMGTEPACLCDLHDPGLAREDFRSRPCSNPAARRGGGRRPGERPPEPEVAVPAANKGGYQRHHPRGYALLLAVEVSDSTAGFDLTRKAAIYANAGVPEYWVLDLPRRWSAVPRNPDGPVYRLVPLFSAPDTATMEGVGEALGVGKILPEQ